MFSRVAIALRDCGRMLPVFRDQPRKCNGAKESGSPYPIVPRTLLVEKDGDFGPLAGSSSPPNTFSCESLSQTREIMHTMLQLMCTSCGFQTDAPSPVRNETCVSPPERTSPALRRIKPVPPTGARSEDV